jgi:hypothetical protein
MKSSKTATWLSMLIAVLVLLASIAGLAIKSIYAREVPSWVVQAYGQDIANLITVVVLVSALYFVNKGSIKAFLVWMGTLITLLYAYVIYAFAVHFNSLFLVYVAIVGLSFYAFFGSMIGQPLDRLQPVFAATTKARTVSVFLLLIAILFALLWLSEDIPAILGGKVPPSVVENGLLTNPVHVLDLGLLLPGMVITAVLLWRNKLLGYLFAVPLLVFSILTGIGILATFLVAGSQGMPTSLGVELLIALIVVVSLVLSVLYLQDVKDLARGPVVR